MLDILKLKSNLDLVAILRQRGVKLLKNGSGFKALCPLHKESSPSFSVTPAKGVWHCFGCNAGGDVFTFVMKQENISFVEAVRKLCKLDVQQNDLEALNRERAQLEEPRAVDRPASDVLRRVTEHWHGELAKAAPAQSYLKKRQLWAPEHLRALSVGYCSGKLTQVIPATGKLKRQLTQLGILNKRSAEFFFKRIVLPIFDDAGTLVNVYGRSIDPDSKIAHLYLPGPHRGIFNPVGLKGATAAILTEALLDALSLILLGFSNTTASYGAGGFTADHLAAFKRNGISRVYCAYDADPAGDTAADQLAHDLAVHGIEVLRVPLPCKDPNDFLKDGGSKEQFQALLDASRLIPVAGGSALAPAAVPPQDSFEISLGDRTYRVEGTPVKGRKELQVVLHVTRGERKHVDTLNLYQDPARARFVNRAYAAFRGQVPKKLLEEDFFSLLDEVEAVARPADAKTDEPSLAPSMSAAQREAAEAYLKQPDLISAIATDITHLGVVGEDNNKLLVYLVATSCQLECALSLSAISQSSAGKSWMINRVLDLFPTERVVRLTRMSPRAIFYEEPARFKHKILFIEEAIGAKDADLGVRSIQSEKRVTNLTTRTDPVDGKLKTQETIVEGPLTYMTSSVEPLDYETSTRGFEVTIDESPAQTRRIVDSLRLGRTLDGRRQKHAVERITDLHRNAQRLLEPVVIVNEYADQMAFPDETLRLRREATKYFSLIDTIAFLHQRQRPKNSFTEGGQTYPYVEVVPADVDLGNRLFVSCLARALSDLRGPTQGLLLKIKEYVTAQAAQRGCDLAGVTFSRREVREWTRISKGELHEGLEELAELEYLEVVAGSFGKRYVYVLAPDHRLVIEPMLPVAEKIVALGLTPADRLVDPAAFRSQRDLPRKR